MNTPTGDNDKYIGTFFTDTGTQWSGDKINAYISSPQRQDDSHNTILGLGQDCFGVTTFRGVNEMNQLNATLEEKGNIIISIPPYVTHAGQWGGIHEGIQKLIENNIGDAEKLEEIALNVYGKWQIMLTREQFLGGAERALEMDLIESVEGAEWDKEEIQEYRASPEFKTNFRFLVELHSELKFGKNVIELNNLLKQHYDKIIAMPVYALDEDFHWGALSSVCDNLRKKLPKDENTFADKLISVFDQNGEFQDKQK